MINTVRRHISKALSPDQICRHCFQKFQQKSCLFLLTVIIIQPHIKPALHITAEAPQFSHPLQDDGLELVQLYPPYRFYCQVGKQMYIIRSLLKTQGGKFIQLEKLMQLVLHCPRMIISVPVHKIQLIIRRIDLYQSMSVIQWIHCLFFHLRMYDDDRFHIFIIACKLLPEHYKRKLPCQWILNISLLEERFIYRGDIFCDPMLFQFFEGIFPDMCAI